MEEQIMNCIDVLDNAVNVNGHVLQFPLSYDEIRNAFGEARIITDEKHGKHLQFFYDDLGIQFEGSPLYLKDLRKKKAYKDDEHIIISLALYVTGNQIYSFYDSKCGKNYIGGLTFLGNKIDEKKMWRSPGGYGYQPLLSDAGKQKTWLHVSAAIYSDNDSPLYDNSCLLKDVNLTFKPERPRSDVNYDIVIPEEECLNFDTFNFKLVIIDELMYKQEVLKPYFDIYDYMAFKKAHWNLETSSNVRAAISYFKQLPIPVSLADHVTDINMDGSDEIYMNIAPEWDGRDDRFDFYKLTEKELKQFKNLKRMLVFGNSNNIIGLKKICEPLGIEVEPLAKIL